MTLRRLGPWLAACAAGALWLALSPPGANDLAGGDEGYYGTMARNVLASPHQLISPSLSPLGTPGDKPPLVPLLIAPFVRAWGPGIAAVRAPFAPSAALVAGGVGALVATAAGPAPALFASALLATLPWFADASRSAAAEIPLTALVTLALLVLAAGASENGRGRELLAGVLIGLAFLCKLWLVAPGALAAAVLVTRRERGRWHTPALLAVTALAVASLHLAAVAAWAPRDLAHWRYIYLGRSLAERVSGEGYASYWRLPIGAYWGTLTRAFGLVLPLVAVGVDVAWRRRAEPVPRALLVWGSGVLLLSLFRVKSGGYAYVVAPAWAGLAALGLDAIARGVRPSLVPLAAGALLTSPLAALVGGQGLPAAAWAAVWGAGLALGVIASPPRSWPRLPAEWLFAAWAVLAVGLGAARSAERLHAPYHTPGYQRVAAAMAPRLAGIPPDVPCFVAPETPTFDFHLFRTGLYWGTPNTPWTAERFRALRADQRLRVFVVDPSQTFYGGWPDSATLVWLERGTHEITSRLPAGPHGERPLRVFVR